MVKVTVHTLLMLACLQSTHGSNNRCAQSSKNGATEECCDKCMPGNRRVKKCGLVADLCVPCENGTYIINPTLYFCHFCTRCIGLRILKHPCTNSMDTVCDCVKGYRCGDVQCSFCEEECGKGHEPNGERTCRECPLGTFNDQIHHKCTPWRTSCPLPEHIIVANGTAVSDSVCEAANPKPSKMPRTGVYTLMIVIIAVCCFCVGLVPSLILVWNSFVKTRKSKTLEKKHAGPTIPLVSASDPLHHNTGELESVVPQEDCSLCQPQQEQGSSRDLAISNKLLPV